MAKRVGCLLALLVQLLFPLVSIQPVLAVSQSLVIYQLQTGAPDAATEEYVSVYNNSTQTIDVTNWCLAKTAASDIAAPSLACVNTEPGIRLMLPGHSHMLFSTEAFAVKHTGLVVDVTFSFSMTHEGGHLRLLGADGVVYDQLSWGNAQKATGKTYEGNPAEKPATDGILQRLSETETVLQDSDDNSVDFTKTVLGILPQSGVQEEIVPVDLCPNIVGTQQTLPTGYLVDELGDCQKDVCLNIDGLQLAVPEGYYEPETGNCEIIPLEGATLVIAELLPNAASVDTGKEFIEIYNPNSRTVSLKGYVLQLGPSFAKSYSLPDTVIGPGTYRAFSDAITGITLPNSSADLRLVAPNGSVVNQTTAYNTPQDDMAWALIGDVWQYTNQPTPGAANMASMVEESPVTDDQEVGGLAPCPTGQYRNPETNRCRLLQTLTSSLTPCREGQERNPETNRCRAVLAATSSLVPCAPNQERNPDTNRCRLVASSALQPCDAGEERNPDTNRCRKVVSAANSDGIAEVKDVASNVAKNSIRWWLAGAAALAALGYAAYEWRHDIANRLHRRRVAKAQAK